MNAQEIYETVKGEGLKQIAEETLRTIGRTSLGGSTLERYAFYGGRRLEHPSLATEIGGVALENPVIVGAGWDKQGRLAHGLYRLGFGSVVVGTVVPSKQSSTRPRLWTIDEHHSVGLNRMKFNSVGVEAVAGNIEAAWPLPCPVGLSVGRNRTTPNAQAGHDHQTVLNRLGQYASYIELALSSVNTEGLRELQAKDSLRRMIHSGRSGTLESKPLFIKIDGERTPDQLDDIIEVAVEEGVDGVAAINSYGGSDLKAKYGERWAQEPGGLSGADPDYRQCATDTVKYIYEAAGDKLDIVGVGGVDSVWAALEKIKAGASAVQVVTAMRPSWGRVAANINRDLLNHIHLDDMKTVKQYIGLDTIRGPKYPNDNW